MRLFSCHASSMNDSASYPTLISPGANYFFYIAAWGACFWEKLSKTLSNAGHPVRTHFVRMIRSEGKGSKDHADASRYRRRNCWFDDGSGHDGGGLGA